MSGQALVRLLGHVFHVNCSVVWLAATDKTGEAGGHVLFHIYPESQEDPMGPIRDETERLKQDGFTELKSAFVTGAYIDQEKFAEKQPEESLKRNSKTAESLLQGVAELGYQKIVDHTRDKRPEYITKEVNIGGEMRKKDNSPLEFIPIGWGVFSK